MPVLVLVPGLEFVPDFVRDIENDHLHELDVVHQNGDAHEHLGFP